MPFTQAMDGVFRDAEGRQAPVTKFYSKNTTAMPYGCVAATPAGTIRIAEFFRVKDGKVRGIRLIFNAPERSKMTAR